MKIIICIILPAAILMAIAPVCSCDASGFLCPHHAEGGDPFPCLPYLPSPCAPAEEGEYFLKVLIPSYAAGSIIGKGGQTIVQLQKETGATIKLSKSKDFYPGEPWPRTLPLASCPSHLGPG